MILAKSVPKLAFFDRAKVLESMDRKTARSFSRFGSFVRKRSQTSIRYRKQVSAPGQPPSAHRVMGRITKNRKRGITKTRNVSPLRELIYFAWDAATRSVVIGPVLFGPGSARQLEEGGQVKATQQDGTVTVIHIRKRPYMLPAFKAELPKAPTQFAETASGSLNQQ